MRTFKNKKGQVIGHLDDANDRILKYVEGSKHRLIKMDAWALDEFLVVEAAQSGLTSVDVVDTESGLTYSVSMAELLNKGIRINYGYGVQIALPLRYWAMTGGSPDDDGVPF